MNAIEKLRELIEANTVHDVVLTTYPCQHGVSCTAETLLAHLDDIERDYMELPKDANGEPIRVGDKVKFRSDAPVEVTMLRLAKMHWGEPTWDFVGDNDGIYSLTCMKEIRHYRAPTVEDVLRGVVTLCANTWKDSLSCFSHYSVDEMMESGNMRDFAAKLREAVRDE